MPPTYQPKPVLQKVLAVVSQPVADYARPQKHPPEGIAPPQKIVL
jgi:hypothetical protein